MCKYDDKTMEPVPPTLAPGEKEHMLVPQDECLVNTNDSPRRQWLKADQQPLKKKAKQKQPKPKARDAIKAAHLESAAAVQSGGEDNESVSSNAVVANGNQKSGLVFPFSYTPLNHAHAR